MLSCIEYHSRADFRQNRTTREDGQAYTPLNPYTMLTSNKGSDMEQARLNARLRLLRRKLEKYGRAKRKEEEK
jgi:hypothetical protein